MAASTRGYARLARPWRPEWLGLQASLFALLALGQGIELTLQRLDLFFQIVEAVPGCGFRLLLPRRIAAGTLSPLAFTLPRPKGREHLHRALEQRNVLLAHLLEIGEGEDLAEGALHVLAHLLLVAGEGLHRLLQIARHQELQVVAVESDQLL